MSDGRTRALERVAEAARRLLEIDYLWGTEDVAPATKTELASALSDLDECEPAPADEVK